MVRDYDATQRKYAGAHGKEGKLRAIFGLLMPHPSPGYPDFGNAIKKLQ